MSASATRWLPGPRSSAGTQVGRCADRGGRAIGWAGSSGISYQVAARAKSVCRDAGVQLPQAQLQAWLLRPL